ncbi:MAG: MMPL family transporter [Lentisphaeria bacterium]|nr:MMPL family transporter [Lentisphaeria bacterium]
MKLVLTNFSMKHPRFVVGLTLLAVLVLGTQFPRVRFDTDPENMLDADEKVRLEHHRIKELFSLYDFVIVGVVNEDNEHGVFNPGTLSRIHTLTRQLASLSRSPEGLPQVREAGEAGGKRVIDLSPAGMIPTLMNVAFRHDPNRLFTAEGDSAIIAREIIAPSVVDNLRQAEFGSLKIEYLMETPPVSQAECDRIREDAMSNPLYRDTLVSSDGAAVALYIPIKEKTFSYTVANLARELTKDWPAEDAVHITGLPVAEDTFGVQMLVQMATSAPLAGIMIFILLLIFFRRVSLIIAPMLLAGVTIVCTMGLLIGAGFPVHIMSSMIAIFLMPIAVADSVHILSEYHDVAHRFDSKQDAIRHVVGHLFMPMLYTSTTTFAGFASLLTTPIPPVRIFGGFVAFGVAAAWLLTMTFVPAYIMLFTSNKMLEAPSDGAGGHPSPMMNTLLNKLGNVSYLHWRLVLAAVVAVAAFSIVGITKINVNDNPVKWFTPDHEIRVADRVMNDHFGGTYTAYLTLAPVTAEDVTCHEKAALIRQRVVKHFGAKMPAETAVFKERFDALSQRLCNMETCDPNLCFLELNKLASELDAAGPRRWQRLGDTINYLDPEGLTMTSLRERLLRDGQPEALVETLLADAKLRDPLTGEALMNQAIAVCDDYSSDSFGRFMQSLETDISAPLFKQPEVLAYVEDLQAALAAIPVVGKTSSAVDALKKAAFELRYIDPAAYPESERDKIAARNEANFSIPASAAAVGQVYTQLEGTKKKDSLFHLVTRDYRQVNIWVQLKSGDNRDMEDVLTRVDRFITANPPPVKTHVSWGGLTYINVEWQKKMVGGMGLALASSAVIVFVMMLLLFRSPVYGLLSMVPLTVTIAFIYGLIGWFGKDYDMPVAVLSSLTLGLSVDFAIHFLERTRELYKTTGDWRRTVTDMFNEPAAAITRNAVTVALGFLPLLLAPLVPYRTVGFFLAAIMAVSWFATLMILPALITLFAKFTLKQEE